MAIQNTYNHAATITAEGIKTYLNSLIVCNYNPKKQKVLVRRVIAGCLTIDMHLI